jgi:hypothetical protein
VRIARAKKGKLPETAGISREWSGFQLERLNTTVREILLHRRCSAAYHRNEPAQDRIYKWCNPIFRLSDFGPTFVKSQKARHGFFFPFAQSRFFAVALLLDFNLPQRRSCLLS